MINYNRHDARLGNCSALAVNCETLSEHRKRIERDGKRPLTEIEECTHFPEGNGPMHEVPLSKRRGKFNITTALLNSLNEEASTVIFADLETYDKEVDDSGTIVTYRACSKHFDPVPDSVEPPFYKADVSVSDDGIIVEWSRLT